jgi:hypothetical protein
MCGSSLQALHHRVIVHDDVVADGGNSLAHRPGEGAEVLCTALDAPVFLDKSRAADADHRSELNLVLVSGLEVGFEHLGKFSDRIVAIEALSLAMPPQLHLVDGSFGQILFLGMVQSDQSGADVAAAHVHRKNCIVPFDHPGRQKVSRTDQARFVRMVVKKLDSDVRMFSFRSSPVRAIASSPTRPVRNPPPKRMHSVSRQAFWRRNRADVIQHPGRR